MISTIRQLEDDVEHFVRKRYEDEGYHFSSPPSASSLPDFLGGAIPYAIASRNGENVVVEIKSDESSAQRSAHIRHFATEVPKHPGWRFDLVLANRRFPQPQALVEPSSAELTQAMESAEKIAAMGDLKTALLAAWGPLESLARQLSLNERRGELKRYPASSTVEILVSDGFLSDDEGTALFELGALRNLVAHGYTRATVSQHQLRLLFDIIRRLIGELANNADD